MSRLSAGEELERVQRNLGALWRELAAFRKEWEEWHDGDEKIVKRTSDRKKVRRAFSKNKHEETELDG